MFSRKYLLNMILANTNTYNRAIAAQRSISTVECPVCKARGSNTYRSIEESAVSMDLDARAVIYLVQATKLTTIL